MCLCSGVERRAAAAFIRERTAAIMPRVIAEAVAGDASSVDPERTRRLLSEYLERRMPSWLVALAANDDKRDQAITRLLRIDEEAGVEVPPVVVLGTIAIGYRVIEQELREHASEYGRSPDDLWAEVDALRRQVSARRQSMTDRGEVA
jgi:hypothetical protein